MSYSTTEYFLKQTLKKVKHQHTPQGLAFIAEHWSRYVRLLGMLPRLDKNSRVLEIGASILSAHIKFSCKSTVTVLYHEIEPEWKNRFTELDIEAHPVELMRDPLPVEDKSFDLILCNEVIEHFPLQADFFMRDLLKKLNAKGMLLFSVPNFATSEKRWQLLCGKNPQDVMDKNYIYYAHHREPVMAECIDLLERSGANIVSRRWVDFDGDSGFIPTLKRHLFHVYRKRFHPLLHLLVPSMRGYIVIAAKAKPGAYTKGTQTETGGPPLKDSMEYVRR